MLPSMQRKTLLGAAPNTVLREEHGTLNPQGIVKGVDTIEYVIYSYN